LKNKKAKNKAKQNSTKNAVSKPVISEAPEIKEDADIATGEVRDTEAEAKAVKKTAEKAAVTSEEAIEAVDGAVVFTESASKTAQGSSVAEESENKRKGDAAIKSSAEGMTFRRILLCIGFGVVLFWLLNNIPTIRSYIGMGIDILSPLIIGGSIAFIMNIVLSPVEKLWDVCFSPIKNEMVKGFISRMKRAVCILISTLVVIGFICGLFFIIIPELTMTVKLFIDMIPGLITRAERFFGDITLMLEKYNVAVPEIKPDTEKIMDFANNFLAERGQQMLNITVDFTSQVFSRVFNIILSVVVAFYVLGQKEKLAKKSKRIVYAVMKKDKADAVINIASLSGDTFRRFVTGQVTEAVIIGVLCWIGMTIFGMPYAAVVSVVIGVTAIVPIFGAFVGAGIGVFLILAVDFMQAVWFLVFILILQQIETNLIYPKMVGKSIGLPGLLVLTAVTVGGALFGFAGIVLGVPVCSVGYCIFNEYVAKRISEKEEHGVREDSTSG